MRQYPSVILPVHTDTYRATQIFMITDLAPINPNYIVELSITKAINGKPIVQNCLSAFIFFA